MEFWKLFIGFTLFLSLIQISLSFVNDCSRSAGDKAKDNFQFIWLIISNKSGKLNDIGYICLSSPYPTVQKEVYHRGNF